MSSPGNTLEKPSVTPANAARSSSPERFQFSALEEFAPPWWMAGPQAQTIFPSFLKCPPSPDGTEKRLVQLADGDYVVLHDDCPVEWKPGDRVVLLVHGLGGSHQSPYAIRMSRLLVAEGIRSIRMDMRGCGAGVELARGVFHAARYPDLVEVSQHIARLCATSPLTICGYSLGGNLLLKMLVSLPNSVPDNVDSAIAVGPPIDLQACCRNLQSGFAQLYDRFFVSRLWREFCGRRWAVTGGDLIDVSTRPSTLEEFDELVTTPLAGFESAFDYYAASSAGADFRQIAIPTAILTSSDDPIVPHHVFQSLEPGDNVQFFATERGGHLGFCASSANRHWLDGQILRWALELPKNHAFGDLRP